MYLCLQERLLSGVELSMRSFFVIWIKALSPIFDRPAAL